MSIVGTVADGLLSLIAAAYPPAAGVIAIAKVAEPYIEAGLPLLRSAIKEGPQAFQAARQAAPELFGHLEKLASAIKQTAVAAATPPGARVALAAPATDHEIASMAAHIAGIDPPGWTHSETQAWWDRASGTGLAGLQGNF